jgi:hypothetical protein
MDATITYDEVAALIGVKILTLEPRLNFEIIWMLRWHFERALQRLPCPQSVRHRWKGMVMARKYMHSSPPNRSAHPPIREQQQFISATNCQGSQLTTPL